MEIKLDIAESQAKDIDEIRGRIGADRGALIKVWHHDKVRQEKAAGDVGTPRHPAHVALWKDRLKSSTARRRILSFWDAPTRRA